MSAINFLRLDLPQFGIAIFSKKNVDMRRNKLQNTFYRNLMFFLKIPVNYIDPPEIRRFHRRGRGSIPRKGVLFTSHTLTLLRSEERK